MTTTAGQNYDLEICDGCLAYGPVTLWFPEKYAADNYSPSSFSMDELIAVCDNCRETGGFSHDPNQKRTFTPHTYRRI